MSKVTYEKKETTSTEVTRPLEDVLDVVLDAVDDVLHDYVICDGHPYLDGEDDGDEYRVSLQVDTVDLCSLLKDVRAAVVQDLTVLVKKNEPEDWTTTALSPQVEEEVA